MTVALLPAIVCVVIMMVNGNIGAGVAVMGAFSLVRFRSVPGSAKEIAVLFLCMGAGLVAGMGYLAYAIMFALILGLAFVLINISPIGEGDRERDRELRITIPEDLNYSEVFADIFSEFTSQCRMISAKTTNMGSLFKLKYDIRLKDAAREKEFIDALRVRNGNLEIAVARQEFKNNEL